MGTFTHGTAGATDQSSIFRGNVGFVSGTWESDHKASGTIITGGSIVLGHDLTVGSAKIFGGSGSVTGTAELVFSNKNTGGNGTTQQGSIQVKEIDPSNAVAGDWSAVVQIA